MKYIDSEKLIAEIERRIAAYQKNFNKADNKIAKLSTDGRIASLKEILPFIASLQQEQPDFDDVDPNHLVHSHYTKVRETKTGMVFWAEYSSEAAEWYEAGTGKAYSISDVEIVKEQPEVELDEFDKDVTKLWGRCAAEPNDSIACLHIETFSEVARHFYELGQSTKYQQDREEFSKLKAKEWQEGYDEGYAKGLNTRKED